MEGLSRVDRGCGGFADAARRTADSGRGVAQGVDVGGSGKENGGSPGYTDYQFAFSLSRQSHNRRARSAPAKDVSNPCDDHFARPGCGGAAALPGLGKARGGQDGPATDLL